MAEVSLQTALLPWQSAQFNRLQALHSNGRLAHAWLFAGKPGIGKLEFALHYTRYLLCRRADSHGPCGACQDCHLFAAGTHPDWLLLQPELRQLKIEAIRDAIEFAQNTSQRGGAKAIVIRPAEAMNLNAANALLKILEEPPAQTYLLLIGEQPGLLLPTLRSRCQLLEFAPPPSNVALAWLKQQVQTDTRLEFYLELAQGAPLHALALLQQQAETGFGALIMALEKLANGEATPVQAAKKCEDLGIRTSIDYQLLGIGRLLTALQTAQAASLPALQPLLDRCTQMPGTVMMRRLHNYHASLMQARRTAMATNNANPQLMLEALFTEWSQLMTTRTVRNP
ncbi:MAG TPA: DNA polymerase III subunit delta' [Candidatus Acidoferrum sp.]|nr:DNA polymerase III subunit delta' [Candidatus Acidoferrum sp.]